ncbi:retrovirus-related pol polyprotein from transposon TNT 1-94 [Tanacetum coccineum]
MHNNIMAVGSYQLTTVTILVVPATDDSSVVPERIVVETFLNMSSGNKEHYHSEKKAIHLLLTGIGDEIYVTVDACKTAHNMWIAIERLQQGESLNIQDVKTNLFWEFGKFTSHDGDSMESYYSGFYKIDPEEAQRDNDMQKNLALIAYYFKKIYKPTNNNLRTSSNSRNKNVDTSPRYKNDNHTREFGNQRTMTVAGARETVGSQVVQQTGIYCFNYKEFGHFAKECRKPKRVKDYTYHKEKMLLCKHAKKGVPLQAEQADWLADTNEQIDEQEFEAHYSYMEKIQEVPTADSKTDTEPLEQIGNDLLTGNRGSDLYTISLQETTSSTPTYFMAKASPTQACLWHRRLSHLNFDYINFLSKKDIVIGLPKLKYVKDQLCSTCELSKAKRSSFKTKAVPSSKGRLNLFHMDLCGPMRVESINGKKYIMVIVDDYSKYTCTLFLRSNDETPEVLQDFFKMIQRNLQAQLITIRTNRGTEFLKKTLHAYFKEEGIDHQTSTPRIPEQNGVVKRQNCTLVVVARMMLSSSKLPLFFWAEAIGAAFYTQNYQS